MGAVLQSDKYGLRVMETKGDGRRGKMGKEPRHPRQKQREVSLELDSQDGAYGLLG